MKRSEFLKRLGLGIVAIPLVPKITTEAGELLDMGKEEGFEYPPMRDTIREDLTAAMEKPGIHDEMVEKFSHYEEPRLHDGQPWPLRVNDTILLLDDKIYLVTAVMAGIATLTPFDGDNDVVYARKGDEMIRFSNNIEQL